MSMGENGGGLPYARFRQDLSIEPGQAGSTSDYRLISSVTHEHFELDEQSLQLLRAFDGLSSPEQIAAAFNARNHTHLNVADLEQFAQEALTTGLLEQVDAEPRDAAQTPVEHQHAESGSSADATADGPEDDDYRWTLFNPSALFFQLARIASGLRWLFLSLVWTLLLTVPLALVIFFTHGHLMATDLAVLGEPRSYFARLVATLFLINLLRCLIQGTLIAYYGSEVRAFGIRLRFGIIPRFFVDKRAIKGFARSAKLWTYGSNLLFRLILVVFAVLTWYLSRGSGTGLAASAIVLTHSALIGLVLVSLPVRASDGYRWLMIILRLPLSTMRLALLSLQALVTRQAAPPSLTPWQRRRLVLYAVLLIGFWIFAFFRISSRIVEGLVSSFPMIFGEATQAIITVVVVLMMVRWLLFRVGKFNRAVTPAAPDMLLTPEPSPELAPERTSGWTWLSRNGVRLIGVIAIVLLLAQPFPYRPGGAVTLLVPKQQPIQAPISGQVVKVLFRGGDGKLISAGEPIAKMVSDELEQDALILREQIREQEAELAKREAQLKQTLAGSRPEAIAEARARKQRMLEELRGASQAVETAGVKSMHSDREFERLQSLPAGLISGLDLGRSEKQADIDRLGIEEAKIALAAREHAVQEAQAQLERLLNGATDDEIEAARQEVAEAKAALHRLHRGRDFVDAQLGLGRLRMPFDGYLLDAHLEQNVGRYLNQGDTFAIAQARSDPLVDLVLPEFDVAEVEVGSRVILKLLAFPGRTFRGEVISIEPTSDAAVFGRTFSLLVELSEPSHLSLKPGMSGFAKIEAGEKPLFVLLTRPLLRFLEVEVWSWLP